MLLKKLELGEKFPRDILHIRKLALRVGLIKPSIILAFLALQLHAGHMRIEDNAAKITQTIQENEGLQYRYNQQIIEVPEQYKLKITMWCDEVTSVLQDRDMIIK